MRSTRSSGLSTPWARGLCSRASSGFPTVGRRTPRPSLGPRLRSPSRWRMTADRRRRTLRRGVLLGTLAAALLVLAGPVGATLSAPVPTGPADGSVLDSLPTFAWSGVTGADHYEFQIAADPAFTSPVLGAGYDDFA